MKGGDIFKAIYASSSRIYTDASAADRAALKIWEPDSDVRQSNSDSFHLMLCLPKKLASGLKFNIKKSFQGLICH